MALLDGAFAIFALFTGWRVRDAEGLLRLCAGIALVYVLLASPVYWPWYAILPLALLALLPYGPFIRIALVLSFGARLGAPLEVLANRGFITLRASHAITAAVGVVLPLLTCLLLAVREWRRMGDRTHRREGRYTFGLMRGRRSSGSAPSRSDVAQSLGNSSEQNAVPRKRSRYALRITFAWRSDR